MERRRGGILAGLAPPLTSYGAELAWVLQRAFGPAAHCATIAPNGGQAVELAERLGLGARLAARGSGIEQEVGLSHARRLTFQQLQVSATARELEAAMARVAEVASERSIPLCWLKFAALRTSGVLIDGAREARDVDVLVPPSRIRELHTALVEAGLPALPGEANHHLPPLRLSTGAIVELHAWVWGVELTSRADGASYEDLLAADALRALSANVNVPEPWLLAAHAMVHGLVQHRGTPQDYAPLRALCDVVDLRVWEMSLERIHASIRRHVSRGEVEDLAQLARALAAGVEPGRLDARAASLLSGLLAASLDTRYQRALILEHAVDLLRAGALGGALWRNLTASRPATAARHSGYSWARLARPLERAIELTHAVVAYARLRWWRSR